MTGTLGFMQPYFLPYPGYFALIRHSDTWVVFDDAQMIRAGWVHRNRVLHPAGGWLYLTVPTRRHPSRAPICRVFACSSSAWRARLLRQLGHYRRAPFFGPVMAMLTEALYSAPDRMDRLCVHTLGRICAFIGIPFHPLLHSELPRGRGSARGPGGWALGLAQTLEAASYINPPGGRGLFDPSAFAEAGISLHIHTWIARPHPQLGAPFEPSLSIVDMLMFLPADEVLDRLDDVRVDVLSP